jgi:hypothetical protein
VVYVSSGGVIGEPGVILLQRSFDPFPQTACCEGIHAPTSQRGVQTAVPNLKIPVAACGAHSGQQDTGDFPLARSTGRLKAPRVNDAVFPRLHVA